MFKTDWKWMELHICHKSGRLLDLFKWLYYKNRAINVNRQIDHVPADQPNLHDQLATTLQASRLLRYHMEMQMQEMYNLYEFFDRSPGDEEPEREWNLTSNRFWKLDDFLIIFTLETMLSFLWTTCFNRFKYQGQLNGLWFCVYGDQFRHS